MEDWQPENLEDRFDQLMGNTPLAAQVGAPKILARPRNQVLRECEKPSGLPDSHQWGFRGKDTAFGCCGSDASSVNRAEDEGFCVMPVQYLFNGQLDPNETGQDDGL
eukprot:3939051-Amphidinium_carterae.1